MFPVGTTYVSVWPPYGTGFSLLIFVGLIVTGIGNLACWLAPRDARVWRRGASKTPKAWAISALVLGTLGLIEAMGGVTVAVCCMGAKISQYGMPRSGALLWTAKGLAIRGGAGIILFLLALGQYAMYRLAKRRRDSQEAEAPHQDEPGADPPSPE